MEQAITFDLILRILGIIAAAWVGIKAISEIIGAVNKWHDKRQKWDDMEGKMLKKHTGRTRQDIRKVRREA